MCSAVFWHFLGTRYLQSSDLRLGAKFHIKHGFRWQYMARPILWSLGILNIHLNTIPTKKKEKRTFIWWNMGIIDMSMWTVPDNQKTNNLKPTSKNWCIPLSVCVHMFGEYREICRHTPNYTRFSGLSLSSVLHIKFCLTTWPHFDNDTNKTCSQTHFHHNFDLCLKANQERQFVWHQRPTF